MQTHIQETNRKGRPASAPGACYAAIVAPYKAELEECCAELLRGVPKSGGYASRAMLKRVLTAAFAGGVVAATHNTKVSSGAKTP